MTERRISASRRRWLDRQKDRHREEARQEGVEVNTAKSKWAYSTRSDPQPPNKR
ncbi:hypothetical protein G6020_10685 [Dietzia sp. B19]|uniref:hypothetical protein n=1 Tax=Dietzia sp. B19 TaxID=1630632 RepID=UPI0015F9B7C5|nr:hypothetical protein [Dietzia sp. B19]MBB1057849.1 hypothetical protein [Dietzia sp. B19]